MPLKRIEPEPSQDETIRYSYSLISLKPEAM